jgi:monofunctional biosynthetic peptidoglycan transglycosylase
VTKGRGGFKKAGKARSAGRGGGFWRALRRLVVIFLLIVLIAPPAGVTIYRFVPPPITTLLIQRLIEGHGLDYRWRPLPEISPGLVEAVVASEDQRFCQHHGFDVDAIEKAMKANERRPDRLRGGSTISQQTAKNVFLWPGRSYVRKGIEAWYTVLIETIWGKRRIMEMYLNVVEFGPGVYGAEAASERFFHVHADELSPVQAARLAAVLPKPLSWKAGTPGPYIARRSGRIDRAMGAVRGGGLADCALR